MTSSTGSDRAAKLHDAFDKALSKWTQSFSFEQFASCFPTLFDQKAAATEQNAALLHSLYIALVSRFIDNATVRDVKIESIRIDFFFFFFFFFF
jgi:hypothetical protein